MTGKDRMSVQTDTGPCGKKQGSFSESSQRSRGFSLIESLLGIALVAVALLGMAQLFTYSVMNSQRADRIANGTFLAQQQIDLLRNLTSGEIATLAANSTLDFNGNGTMDMWTDEQININLDARVDFRRITDLQASGVSWNVRVLVFSGNPGDNAAALLANPRDHRVQADIRAFIK